MSDAFPREALGILTARTLANSHPLLLERLAPGMTVLDVGCGPGALTAEMARLVDPGHAVGMDVNPEMIAAAEAAHPPSAVPNLIFYRGDVRESAWDGEFDLVNAARVLQWIAPVATATAAMARATSGGGLVVVRDYDHGRAEWADAPPAWRRFYEAFLAWRVGAGLDNALAPRLPTLLAGAGLVDVTAAPQAETVRAGDPDFYRVAGTWRLVADGRGRQMVEAGYLGEGERRAAVDAFTEWMQRGDATQTIHEATAIGRRPPE